MNAQFLMRFDYEDEEDARMVVSSVSMDNIGFVRTRLEGSTLISEASAGSILSLLHTLDDYLSCLTVAENIIRKRSRKGSP